MEHHSASSSRPGLMPAMLQKALETGDTYTTWHCCSQAAPKALDGIDPQLIYMDAGGMNFDNYSDTEVQYGSGASPPSDSGVSSTEIKIEPETATVSFGSDVEVQSSTRAASPESPFSSDLELKEEDEPRFLPENTPDQQSSPEPAPSQHDTISIPKTEDRVEPVRLTDGRWMCSLPGCRTTAQREYDIRSRHMLTHAAQKTAICPDCGKGFLRHDGMVWHKRNKRCSVPSPKGGLKPYAKRSVKRKRKASDKRLRKSKT